MEGRWGCEGEGRGMKGEEGEIRGREECEVEGEDV